MAINYSDMLGFYIHLQAQSCKNVTRYSTLVSDFASLKKDSFSILPFRSGWDLAEC